MNTAQQTPASNDKSLYRRLREVVFPVKPGDGELVKFGKNAGFVIFLAMASFISVAFILAIAFAL